MNWSVVGLLLLSYLCKETCAFNQRLCYPFHSVSALITAPSGSWEDSYDLANAMAQRMTLNEKIGIVSGTGQLNSQRWLCASSFNFYWLITDVGRCVGETTPVARLGIPSLCFNDGPAGVRLTTGVTGFPSGINTASTFSRRLMRARGQALGEEFRGKGIK